MELVDVPDSKSGAARRGGSSPPRGTIKRLPSLFPKTYISYVSDSLDIACSTIFLVSVGEKSSMKV